MSMLKPLLGITGIALALGGCASHIHPLKPGTAATLRAGQFHHGPPSRLVLESGERRYVAEGFEVRRHMDWNELRKAYQGSNPKHWYRIVAGHDKEHESYSAEARATAADGRSLACRLGWLSNEAPKGACVDEAGNEHELTFE